MLLENLTNIPETLNTIDNWQIFNNARDTLLKYIPTGTIVKNRTYTCDDVGHLMQMACVIDAINCIDTDICAIFLYMNNSPHRFKAAYDGERYSNKTIGIVINHEAGTHFIEDDYQNIKRMPAIEKMLKQSSGHFLRIFTSPNNKVLYVWTNQELEPATLYHLKNLQNSLDNKVIPEPKQYVTDFYKALLDRDLEKLKESLETFMNSDYVKDYDLRKFKECLNYNITNKIKRYETALTQLRLDIASYEEAICRMASDIRDKNEAIEILRNKDQEEDIKILFNYLKKHPYITKYEASSKGTLTLDYTAPLLYYNEYALDKLIKNRYGMSKFILELIKERKYTLWTKCKLKFNTVDFCTYIEDSDYFLKYAPHPHIERYHCFGNHQAAISESATSGDYLGAIEQITQAVLNINFYDTCVVNTMVNEMIANHNEYKTWYEEATGEFVSLEDIKRKENFTE